MPSLKMKTKSTTGCLREKHGLHVCQKSSMISKSPLSHASIPQNVVVKTPIHSSQDVSLCKNESNIVGAEVKSNELLNAEDLVLQKEESPSNDFSVESRMGSESATCFSSLETIFSPIQELIDISSELFVCSDGGNNDIYVPQLETEDSDDSSRDSCKYQTCGMSDFYISDMIVSGLPVEGNSIYDDSTESKFLHHYQCNDEPTIFFDMTEDYMVMPFLEDTINTCHVQDNSRCGETMIDSSDTSFGRAIHQVRSCNQESSVNYIPDSDQAECFDPHIFLRNLPDLPDAASNLRPQKAKPITLALDLDETLVHSTLEPCEDADFTFSVFFNMKEHIVYVKERPHLRTFLERVAEMFEIVIFTASQSIYAKQLLDILDPDGKLISRRAYRESCIFSDGTYTKDLNVLGVDLAKVVIIDNSPQVFRLQVNNGIPIKSWFDDPSDSALLTLLPFLATLADADDVRPIIAERFGHVETHIVLASIGIIVGMHSCLHFWNFMRTASTLIVTQFLIDVFP